MRMLLLLMLAIVSLPVSAEEVQFNLNGLAFPVVDGLVDGDAVPVTFRARFDIDTLSGLSSFSFSNGCLNAWNFSNAAANVSASVGGLTVLSQPSTTASGFGGTPISGLHCSPDDPLENGGIDAGKLALEEVFTSITKPPNPSDPLADILPNLCKEPGSPGTEACNIAFVPGWAAEVSSVAATSVPEPGTRGLMLLGLSAVGLLLYRRDSRCRQRRTKYLLKHLLRVAVT